MQGDDIRDLRQDAQGISERNPGVDTFRNLALWVIAEQLFELRSLLGVVIDRDRKEVNIFVNGGSVEAK